MSPRILLAAILILPTSGLFAQTLEEAVQTTLRTNPDVMASQYNVEAASELARQAKGAYYPSVDLVLSGGRESSNNTTTRAISSDDLRLTREERSLRVTQMLYDGFSTRSLVEQQSALTESAIARLASTQESIAVRAIQVYLEVMRRSAVVTLTEENLGYHDNTLGKISERLRMVLAPESTSYRLRAVELSRKVMSYSQIVTPEMALLNFSALLAKILLTLSYRLKLPAYPQRLKRRFRQRCATTLG